ncbi:hypothetical protein QCA50_020898 [Cerrena zonata]|uniref:Uncharacterized protein n=1 Tax=Cerrena zonata TaxID=2478898 RepID=A0AAW0F9N4_9APHY
MSSGQADIAEPTEGINRMPQEMGPRLASPWAPAPGLSKHNSDVLHTKGKKGGHHGSQRDHRPG